ncbi:MAG: sodium:solute symporter [Salibacteraceae bacterium]
MEPTTVILFIAAYFLMLVGVAWLTTRKGDNQEFFLGNRRSPWYVVAFGMIGTSLSGVTFISVPGWVEAREFAYMQMVFGYVPGYLLIATVLLPLYYRLRLTSIYTYLEQRFGPVAYRTGAFYFLLSRTIGASYRLYLVALVLQLAVLQKLGVVAWFDFLGEGADDAVFGLTVVITVLLIWLYTFRGGIKTIIWTDTLQTLFMLLAVGVTVWAIATRLDLGPTEVWATVQNSEYSRIFFFDDFKSGNHFIKQFLSGAFIAIAMTGLDQDMMQKNLSCRNLRDAQKNVVSLSLVLVVVNLVFLSLGALLFTFAREQGIALPDASDELYPMLALDGHLGTAAAVLFVLGLVAAAYSSADSALTALTTSFCVDFLGIEKREPAVQVNLRKKVHIGFSIALVVLILLFRLINDGSVIQQLFTIAGYTYGPLLGLYAFGMFTQRKVVDGYVWAVCIAAPLICFFLKSWLAQSLGYQMSFELLIVNGLFTFFGLWLIRPGKDSRLEEILD